MGVCIKDGTGEFEKLPDLCLGYDTVQTFV